MSMIEKGGTLLPGRSDAHRLALGSAVACEDGRHGHLRGIVLDPASRAVTHLVVHVRHESDTGHLVPVELVDSAAGRVCLGCSRAELDALPEAQVQDYQLDGEESWDDPSTAGRPSPFFYTGRVGTPGTGGRQVRSAPVAVTRDRVPDGEVELLRGQAVLGTDGPVGHISGLLVDRDDHRVTFLLVCEGLLHGRREVAVPNADVRSLEDTLAVGLTRDDVRRLPAIVAAS